MHPPSALRFLIAARRSEIGDLAELTRTAELMRAVSSLVHQLQRERGLSNLLLASEGRRFAAERQAQLAATDEAYTEVGIRLQRLDPRRAAAAPATQGSRLYARIAQALQAQAAAPALRAAVQGRRLDAARATLLYARIVSAWLSVVFEAADLASDADVSRALVSLFHLMHAREQAGQERAAGSALFAAGRIDPEDRLRLHDPIEAQERGIAGFEQFATASAMSAWRAVQALAALRDRQRMRRLLLDATPHGALNPALSEAWFQACTTLMDGMKGVEDALLADLRELCLAKGAALERELAVLSDLEGTAEGAVTPEQALAMLEAAGADGPQGEGAGLFGQAGPQIVALVQTQAQRLHRVSAELDAARAALQERKLIERAKGLLMASTNASEEEAHRMLRRMAMDQGRRLIDIATAMVQRTN